MVSSFYKKYRNRVIRMKKIFIASHCMELGGAERSLLGILNSIDYKKYEVDLFLYRHTGELLKYIPEEVNLLPVDKQMSMLAIPFSNVIKKGQFSMAWGRYQGKKKALKFEKENENGQESMVMLEYSHKYTIPYVKKTINKSYDLAISFLTPHYYVADKINAKVKLAWIHTDYSNYLLDVKSELQMWSCYDHIASISPKCTEGFLKVFPELKDKIIEISNVNAEQLIRAQAKEKIAYDMETETGEICLCSIGRFAHAKNFDHIPAIAKKIKEKDIKFKWFIIGYGGDEQLIRDKIKESGMEDYVIILGKKANPYPYIKKCDIYIQPSRYEGKAVTVIEAQMLEKPVIITAFPSSSSQLEDGVDGVIVPMDDEGCAKGIVDVINNKELQEKLVKNCRMRDYSSSKEVEKLYKLMGD